MHVGDLQAVTVTDLLRLENCIQVLHGDDGFGKLGLGFDEGIEEGFQNIRETKRILTVCRNDDVAKLTSSLIKYLRVKSFRDSRKILFKNCLLSLPFFHSVDSNRSGLDTANRTDFLYNRR